MLQIQDKVYLIKLTSLYQKNAFKNQKTRMPDHIAGGNQRKTIKVIKVLLLRQIYACYWSSQ